MAKSWKCARCATENTESAVSCQGCGMIRGAVVTSVNVGQTPPIPPPPVPSPPASSSLAGAQPPLESWQVQGPAVKPRRMRLPLQLILLAVLIGGGLIYGYINNAGRSGNGDINKAGELSVTDLRAGDCFDLVDPTASAIDKTTAKPCTESHQNEVFYAGTLPDGDYPTDESVKAFVTANCLPVFTTYVGTAYKDSNLDVEWFSPIPEAWNHGRRGIQCTVYDPTNSHLTASLKGSNR